MSITGVEAVNSNKSGSTTTADANEESGSDEEDTAQSDTATKLHKYVQQLTGKKVCDAGLQTGGPGAKVSKKVMGKKKCHTIMQADAVSKMRVALPLL